LVKRLDKIIEIAGTDERIRVFRSRANQGTYNIRNDLIKRAKGEYIAFQDSDDYTLPNRIEIQLRSLLETGKTMCNTQWMRITPEGSFVFFHDDRVSRFCVVSSMVRREVFDLVPQFRSSLVAADTEFYQTMIDTFGEDELCMIDKPLLLGLWGEGSLTQKRDLKAKNSGYVAVRRQNYSDIAARQRALGKGLVVDEEVEKTLKDNGIFMKHHSVEEYKEGVWQ
jgi:glycosyltransferase involved in cell wall biosynthesis